MSSRFTLALLALAATAVPATAQIGTSDRIRDVILGDRRAGSTVDGRRGDVIHGRSDARTSARSPGRIPPGHLPPRGACRVWIDGVPPGRQPAVTSCAQAERDRLSYGANARVVYGDRATYRGENRSKLDRLDKRKKRQGRACQIRDAVVLDGRAVDVCSDDRARRDRERVRKNRGN